MLAVKDFFQNTHRVLVSKGADIAFTDERQSVFSTSHYITYTISSARILSIPGLPFSLSYTNKLHIHKSTNPSLFTHTPN